MKKLLLLAIFFFLGVNFAHAYYADIQIDVNDAGYVSIEGITNHPTLLTQDVSEFTSKEGKYWILNITSSDLYEDLVYKIHLPDGSIVNYVKLPDFGRIETDGGIIISGAASNKKLEIVIQYSIENSSSSSSFPIWIVFVLTLAIMILMYLYKTYISDSQKESSLDLSIFPPRQKRILKHLQQHGGELTQSKLEKFTKFPKSSLSRNINSLVRKDVVEKHNIGSSNSIRIKKKEN